MDTPKRLLLSLSWDTVCFSILILKTSYDVKLSHVKFIWLVVKNTFTIALQQTLRKRRFIFYTGNDKVKQDDGVKMDKYYNVIRYWK